MPRKPYQYAAVPCKVVSMDTERFWAKVDKSGECWEWTAARHEAGYGVFAVGRKTKRAHRIAYELLIGPIPEGMQLDHLCRNRACVNPAHLEPVTNWENGLRGVGACAKHALKTHCPHGHEYTPENTYQRKDRPGRDCRTCMSNRSIARRGKRGKQRAA